MTTDATLPPSSPAAGSINRGTRRSSEPSPETRLNLITAAIETIYEEGYYRASSNAIARRAGVSWGVIQYYFGTREALLMAVIEHTINEAIEILSEVKIVGETVEERLQSFADAIFAIYGRPDYLSVIEILWNLTRSPTQKESTYAELLDWVGRQNEIATRLLAQVSPVFADSEELQSMMLFATGGLAISQDIGRLFYPSQDVPGRRPDTKLQRQAPSVRALASLI